MYETAFYIVIASVACKISDRKIRVKCIIDVRMSNKNDDLHSEKKICDTFGLKVLEKTEM